MGISDVVGRGAGSGEVVVSGSSTGSLWVGLAIVVLVVVASLVVVGLVEEVVTAGTVLELGMISWVVVSSTRAVTVS